MVKAKRKPVKEIENFIKDYEKTLIVACGGCVSVCLAGGQKEAMALGTELNTLFRLSSAPNRCRAYTVERQCNESYLTALDDIVEEYDCLLSMACGAGVQFLAERFSHKPVFPAVNTTSIGTDRDVGVYEERCRACGECVIGYTGGTCPVTRCAKGLFNGPCGGVRNGMCETSQEVPCAWVEIYERLGKQNRLDNILTVFNSVNWQNQLLRLTIQEPYEKRYIKKTGKKN